MTQIPSHSLFEQFSDMPLAATGIRPGGLALTRRALALVRLTKGGAALDVGCGTGVTVEHLIREHALVATGVDSSSVLVSRGKARNACLPLLIGEAEFLPFKDESFDVVFFECVISLISERNRVLQECYRVLKPEAWIVVTDLYARNEDAIDILRKLPMRSCLKGALDKDQFVSECLSTGFEGACFEDHSSLLQDFALQMIFTYGSLDRFWLPRGDKSLESCVLPQPVRQARIGYFLFLGCKASTCSNTTLRLDKPHESNR